MLIHLTNSGLHCAIDTDGEGKARLIHFSAAPFDEAAYDPAHYHKYYTLVELHCLGEDINDHHGSRYTLTSPGAEMRYRAHTITDNDLGRLLEVELSDGRLDVTVHMQFVTGVPVARCWNTVVNRGPDERVLTYIASFVYYGMDTGGWEQTGRLDIPHNTWHGELQWRRYGLPELGLSRLNCSSLKRLSYMQLGSWSSSEYLPLAVYENTRDGSSLFWQIEHNGSWYWECSDVRDGGLYVQAGGPNDDQHHCRIPMPTGGRFETVPVAAGVSPTGFDGAMGALTRYRRRIRRPNADNERLPVIFNDYMNCLMGDPSEEKLLPLIDAAAAAGCEYFVIDAGWYTDREGGDDAWWSTIGQWEPSTRRFPHGLKAVTDRIQAHGMVPGVWIEIEGIGPDCPLADTLPEDWFFQRQGRRIKEHNRYQLDFRHPEVRAFVARTLETLMDRYGVGYFKIDYNINAGCGTDWQCTSPGEGLLQHNRALLAFLDELLAKHPDLVIENCASGGMRMDYAMLSRLSIQSMSDQTDCYQYACIAAMAASGVTPEQGAVWSYPNAEHDEEETIFNMVNVLLGRVHQSGFLNRLPAPLFERVKEGIRCYKSIRADIREAVPVYPLGLIHLRDPWSAAGLLCGETLYLSVWRIDAAEDTVTLPLPFPQGRAVEAACLYPADRPVAYRYDAAQGCFVVTLPQQRCARFFKLTLKA